MKANTLWIRLRSEHDGRAQGSALGLQAAHWTNSGMGPETPRCAETVGPGHPPILLTCLSLSTPPSWAQRRTSPSYEHHKRVKVCSDVISGCIFPGLYSETLNRAAAAAASRPNVILASAICNGSLLMGRTFVGDPNKNSKSVAEILKAIKVVAISLDWTKLYPHAGWEEISFFLGKKRGVVSNIVWCPLSKQTWWRGNGI